MCITLNIAEWCSLENYHGESISRLDCSLLYKQLKAISLDTMNEFHSKWEQISLVIIKLD